MGFASYAQSLQKGRISEILQDQLDRNEDPVYARVLPLNADGVVTLPLVIPWYLRGEMGALEVNTDVFFATVEDGSGIILARADGEWNGYVPGDVTIEKGNVVLTDGDMTLNGKQSITGDQNVTGVIKAASVEASGTVQGTDVKSSGADLNTVHSNEQNTESALEEFKTEYQSHTHTTEEGTSTSPPV